MEEERIQLYKKAARSIVGNEPQEENRHQHSISFAFSLQILSSEGLAVKGDATLQKTTTGVPQRASRPDDTNDLYDDQQLGVMPRSAMRWKPTSPTQAGQDITHTHTPAPQPPSRRITGNKRAGLWALLVLCIAFLVDGIALPAWESFNDQLHYGDARISTYDINGRHWLTEDTNGKARIVATTSDGQHTQVLTTNISGGNKHQLITLVQDGDNVDVVVNGVQLSTLVPDGHGGYKWGGN